MEGSTLFFPVYTLCLHTSPPSPQSSAPGLSTGWNSFKSTATPFLASYASFFYFLLEVCTRLSPVTYCGIEASPFLFSSGKVFGIPAFLSGGSPSLLPTFWGLEIPPPSINFQTYLDGFFSFFFSISGFVPPLPSMLRVTARPSLSVFLDFAGHHASPLPRTIDRNNRSC